MTLSVPFLWQPNWSRWKREKPLCSGKQSVSERDIILQPLSLQTHKPFLDDKSLGTSMCPACDTPQTGMLPSLAACSSFLKFIIKVNHPWIPCGRNKNKTVWFSLSNDLGRYCNCQTWYYPISADILSFAPESFVSSKQDQCNMQFTGGLLDGTLYPNSLFEDQRHEFVQLGFSIHQSMQYAKIHSIPVNNYIVSIPTFWPALKLFSKPSYLFY